MVDDGMIGGCDIYNGHQPLLFEFIFAEFGEASLLWHKRGKLERLANYCHAALDNRILWP
jgi:hypothetical protein